MKFANATRVALIVTLLWILPCAAQYGYDEPDHWHMKATMGFNFFNTSDTPVVNGSSDTSSYNNMAGDLGVDLTGFLKDPKLLQFDTSFTTQHGSNSVNAGDYNDSQLGGGFSL